MNLSIPTIGVLTTVVLLASVGAIYAVTFASDLSLVPSSGPSGGAHLVGNLKVTQFDENDNIIAYRTGQNHITATGMSIIMGQVFQGINGSYPTQPNVTGTVAWMEIGTGGDGAIYANQLRWNNSNIIEPVGGNCIRIQSLITNSTGTHTSPNNCYFGSTFYPGGWDGVSGRTDCAAQMNVTAVANFDGNLCNAVSIDEAGIFTSNTQDEAGLMFARNTFGSVTLNGGDTLQLQWEFTFKDTVP